MAVGINVGNSRKIKRMSERFKSGASFCKDQDGNMLTDIKSSLELWRPHFNATLNGDDTNNPANEMIRPSWHFGQYKSLELLFDDLHRATTLFCPHRIH